MKVFEDYRACLHRDWEEKSPSGAMFIRDLRLPSQRPGQREVLLSHKMLSVTFQVLDSSKIGGEKFNMTINLSCIVRRTVWYGAILLPKIDDAFSITEYLGGIAESSFGRERIARRSSDKKLEGRSNR